MNKTEVTRAKIDKWGKIVIAGLVCLAVSPIIFAVVKGALGLLIAFIVGATTLTFTPWFTMKLANWKVKAIVAEAKANPIETLTNLVIDSKKAFDTTEVSDGVYQLIAKATHKKGTSKSQVIDVSVLNGKITGTVGFSNITAGDEITGKKPLNITSTSSPVPFSKVRFEAKNLATGKIISRETTNVAPKLVLGWDTTKATPGSYELKVLGLVGNQKVSSAPITITVK
jgi:hypothetical protein